MQELHSWRASCCSPPQHAPNQFPRCTCSFDICGRNKAIISEPWKWRAKETTQIDSPFANRCLNPPLECCSQAKCYAELNIAGKGWRSSCAKKNILQHVCCLFTLLFRGFRVHVSFACNGARLRLNNVSQTQEHLQQVSSGAWGWEVYLVLCFAPPNMTVPFIALILDSSFHGCKPHTNKV